ncbi:MAG TPA: efflux RND transporter permease subunit, partial [Opitutus sp.]|nr:efflux RND transporter permease subunit [Opitutus sp.]
MKLLVWPLRHREVVFVLSVIVLGLGLHALLTMPRQDTPTIAINKSLVIALSPGATAAQVEQQITRPIESYLFTFTEINAVKTSSVTRDGQVVVT